MEFMWCNMVLFWFNIKLCEVRLVGLFVVVWIEVKNLFKFVDSEFVLLVSKLLMVFVLL